MIQKETLEALIEKGYSQRRIASILKMSQGNVKYWLKIHALSTQKLQYNKSAVKEKICVRCGEKKDADCFYKKNKIGNGTQNHCKDCSNELVSAKQIETKLKIIEYKGGQCEHCGIKLKDSHYCIFELHHVNPSEKEKNFYYIRSWNWDKVKKHIDKCMLLCSNCHRLEHVRLRQLAS